MIQYELCNESFIGAVHKWHDPHIGERGICQRWHYTINQIGDKEGSKNLKKWVTSFMDGHVQNMCSRHKQKSIEYQKAYLKKSAALECIEFRVGSAKSMPCCDTGE